MSTLIELRPDRNLLDANFNGYKLSLDSIPVYRHYLETDVDRVQPSYDQYSFLHIKIFGLHNHLYNDPWSRDDVYFIDKRWRIQKSVGNQNTGVLDGIMEVWEMPSNHMRKSGHYNTSLSFASPDLAVLADGAGTLHVVNTGLRSEATMWKVMFSDEVCGTEKSFIIIDSRVNVRNSRRELNILLLWVDEVRSQLGDGDEHSTFVTKLEWITISEGETQDWCMQNIRQLSGQGGLDYAALEPGCESIYILSEKLFEFVSDSENPIIENKESEEVKVKQPEYTWMQTAQDILVWFVLAEDISKSDLNISVNTDNIKIECKDVVLLAGPTFQSLDPFTSWTIDKRILHIMLKKAEQGSIWQELVKGDSRGEELSDPGFVQEVHERLAHHCSDKEVTNPSASCPPAFNSEELEECDALPLDSLLLVRLETRTHAVSHRIIVGGNRWLFNVSVTPDSVPAICLRHDVDGCLWQMEKPKDAEDWTRTHIGTFLAFGYVQASKEQKKFCTSAPDMSYVAVCEANRRIFVYHQPVAITSELRNRRTGQQVAHVAKQHVVNLDSATEILGVHASSHMLYVLTTNTLFALRVNHSPNSEN